MTSLMQSVSGMRDEGVQMHSEQRQLFWQQDVADFSAEPVFFRW